MKLIAPRLARTGHGPEMIYLFNLESSSLSFKGGDLFSAYVPVPLVFPQAHEPRVAQVIIGCPLDKLELPDEPWLQPQCRMPDYAASSIYGVVITAFGVILLRHIQAEYASTE